MIQEAINRYLLRTKQNYLSPKAVLFDMDGVLYDSMRFHARAWNETAMNHHLQAVEEDFYMYEGRTGDSTINELFQRTFQRNATEKEKKEIYEEKAAFFNRYNDGKAMSGAADVLAAAKAAGLQTLVVTGSGQHSLINKLEHTYPGYFTREKMVTAFDVKYGKPHPEPYLMGLEKAGVKANEAFVVENAPMGVEAGVSAGIFTIAVNTGPLPDKVLLDAGADLLYPDMTSLANDWDNIMKYISVGAGSACP
ncbi:HAD-IA family hydrolase [Parabacteroides sp.]|uniref:HAD-IA family hydrolase n=1 Tax=Parabacteroides sp. TaxID=1869337 RepID=UPI00308004BC